MNLKDIPTQKLFDEINRREEEEWKLQQQKRVEEMVLFKDKLKSAKVKQILIHGHEESEPYEVHMVQDYRWTPINKLRKIDFGQYRINLNHDTIEEQVLKHLNYHTNTQTTFILYNETTFLLRAPHDIREITK